MLISEGVCVHMLYRCFYISLSEDMFMAQCACGSNRTTKVSVLTLHPVWLADSCASRDSPVSNSHPSMGALEIRDTLYYIQLYTGSGDSSSGPHI